ncbi:hypothetical protein BC828DRAFT_381181 [Blastocladiella britannica]|nr:hypothetical protein BC828DRAFT_381181 [Blastocladiella britannica]
MAPTSSSSLSSVSPSTPSSSQVHGATPLTPSALLFAPNPRGPSLDSASIGHVSTAWTSFQHVLAASAPAPTLAIHGNRMRGGRGSASTTPASATRELLPPLPLEEETAPSSSPYDLLYAPISISPIVPTPLPPRTRTPVAALPRESMHRPFSRSSDTSLQNLVGGGENGAMPSHQQQQQQLFGSTMAALRTRASTGDLAGQWRASRASLAASAAATVASAANAPGVAQRLHAGSSISSGRSAVTERAALLAASLRNVSGYGGTTDSLDRLHADEHAGGGDTGPTATTTANPSSPTMPASAAGLSPVGQLSVLVVGLVAFALVVLGVSYLAYLTTHPLTDMGLTPVDDAHFSVIADQFHLHAILHGANANTVADVELVLAQPWAAFVVEVSLPPPVALPGSMVRGPRFPAETRRPPPSSSSPLELCEWVATAAATTTNQSVSPLSAVLPFTVADDAARRGKFRFRPADHAAWTLPFVATPARRQWGKAEHAAWDRLLLAHFPATVPASIARRRRPVHRGGGGGGGGHAPPPSTPIAPPPIPPPLPEGNDNNSSAATHGYFAVLHGRLHYTTAWAIQHHVDVCAAAPLAVALADLTLAIP